MLNRNCAGFIFQYTFKSFLFSPHTVNYSSNRDKILLLIALPKWNHAVCTKSKTTQMRYAMYSVLNLPLGEIRCLSVFVQLVLIML